MTKTKQFTIVNRLDRERRNIALYQHASGRGFLIGHGGSVSVEINCKGSDDYLHLSVSKGPGPLQRGCRVTLPGWLDFSFKGGQGVTGISFKHKGKAIDIDIPPGPPDWEIKISLPDKHSIKSFTERILGQESITVTSTIES